MRTPVAALALAAVVLIAACAGTVDEPPAVGEPPPGAILLLPETITMGGHHSCGLTERGSAYCWGWNGQGQLGVGDEHRIDRHYPTAVAGELTFAQISAGAAHTCGVTTSGDAYCWGWNASGQLGDGTMTRQLVPQPVAGGLSFTQISASVVEAGAPRAFKGGRHTCALSTTGAVYCWGSNYFGQLGDGTQGDHHTPMAIASDLAFEQISAGARHTCGVSTSGAAYCWGNHYDGEVGDGTDTYDADLMNESLPRPTPTAVVGGHTFAQISAGGQHTCGLTTAGAAHCWGNGLSGQLGDGIQHAPAKSPSAVVGDRTYSQISAGGHHTCAQTPSGEAWCWGSNYDGQLGDGYYQTQSASPRAVVGGHTFTQISTGNRHSCGMTPSGEAYCWGYNYNGQVGLFPYRDLVPHAVPAPAQVKAPQLALAQISTGGHHTCALASWGEAFCWGWNLYGQLGDGTTGRRSTPGAVGGLEFAQISAGMAHTCGLTSAGAAYCWGNNERGQLGDGTTGARPSPVRVQGEYVFTRISSGHWHTCALTASGQAYCWGADGVIEYHTPGLVLGGTTFTQLSAGDRYTCALGEETAYCWGSNPAGQLGNGTTLTHPDPTPVSGELTFTEVSAGASHACGRTTSEEAYCWGWNYHGQLGDGTTIDRHVPTLAENPPYSISTGSDHSCGLISNSSTGPEHNAAYCWGRNDFGQLGDGTTTQRLTPTAAIGGLSFAQISAGGGHTCGLDAAGAAYCWGTNSSGQLGDGTTTIRTAPTASAEVCFKP
jgi:alpha-tubulin suppressor-like RCC1 family protein